MKAVTNFVRSVSGSSKPQAPASTQQKALTESQILNLLSGGLVSGGDSQFQESVALRSGLESSVWAYASIKLVTDAFASVDWYTEEKKEDKATGRDEWRRMEDHSTQKLLERPNPYMSRVDFMSRMGLHIMLTGNSYAWINFRRVGRNKFPKELHPIDPDHIEEVQSLNRIEDKHVVKYYEGQVDDDTFIKWDPDEIFHTLFQDPDRIYKGFAPFAAALRTIETDSSAVDWNKNALSQRTVNDIAITLDTILSDEQFREVLDQIQNEFGGAKAARRPMVLGAGAKVNKLISTPVEMDFTTSRKINLSEISSSFGVLPALFSPDAATFCLPADSRVWVPNGVKRIADVKNGDTVWSVDDGEIVKRRVLRSEKTGNKKVFRVKTKNREIVATDNHPFLVRKPGSIGAGNNDERRVSYEWKELGSLNVGDCLVQPKALPDLGKDLFSPDEMKMFGMYQGDGYIKPDGRTIEISIPQSSRVANQYRDLAQCVFTKQSSHTYGNTSAQLALAREPVSISEKVRSFAIGSVETVRLLEENGLSGSAQTKRIPGWVFEASRDCRLAFMAGWVDSDGHVDSRGALTFGICNRDLVEDLKQLMISCGIQVSNVRHQKISADRLPNKGSKDFYDGYYITASSAVEVAQIPFEDGLYRERVEANPGRIRPHGKDAAKAGLSNDLGFYSIVSIEEEAPVDVYDICVEGSHSFIADGVVVHNSNLKEARRALWIDTVIPLLRIYQASINRQLVWPYFGNDKRVNYDLTQVEALKDNLEQRVMAWETLINNGVPLNMASSHLQIGLPPIEGGDEPHGLRPIASQIIQTNPQGTQSPRAPENPRAFREPGEPDPSAGVPVDNPPPPRARNSAIDELMPILVKALELGEDETAALKMKLIEAGDS